MTATTRKSIALLAILGAAIAVLLCLPAAAAAQEQRPGFDRPEGSISGVVPLTEQDTDKREVIDTVYVNTASLYFHDGDAVAFTGTVPAGAHYGFVLAKNADKWGYDYVYAGFEEWRCSNDAAASSDGYDYAETFSVFDEDLTYTYNVCLMVEDADKYRFSDDVKLVLNGRETSVSSWSPEESGIMVYFEDAATLSHAPWYRLWGNTALDTMASIAQEGWDAGDTDVAIVATMSGYHDALAAAPLAGAYDAPVLLTKKTELSAQTKAELERLGIEKVFIVGGPAAVSTDVDDAIAAMGIEVERVYGDNAQLTAIAIGKKAYEGVSPSEDAIVATGGSYQDALAIAPWAYARVVPIYLTNKKGELSDASLAALAEGGHNQVVIVGGTAAVPDSTKAKIEGLGLETTRLGGTNALDTSQLIATWCVDRDPRMRNYSVGVATAGGYHDALAGAALCGKMGVPLVLVNKAGTNFLAIDGYVAAQMSDFAYGYVFGGPSAVNDNVWFHLTDMYEQS